MKPIFWQLAVALILIVYAANWSTITPVGGDEKIYVISAAYLDEGLVLNGEHPPLVKWFYQLVLSSEYKAAIVAQPDLISADFWVPGKYSSPEQKHLVESGAIYLRLVNGFLMSAVLFVLWWRSRDFMLFLSIYALLFIGDLIFSSLLDAWLIPAAILGYYLVANESHKGLRALGFILSLGVAPLTKFYGFLTTPFAILKSRSAFEFAAACMFLVFILGFVWGLSGIFDGVYHYGRQLGYIPDPQKGSVGWWFYGFPLRYAAPFIGILLVKYRGKHEEKEN